MSSLHILSTGISLLNNFVRDNSTKIPGLSGENAHQYSQQIEEYLVKDPIRACGEINSLHNRTRMLDDGNQDLQITLVHTETEQGNCVASILAKFLKSRKISGIHKVPLRGFDKPARDFDEDYAQKEASESLKELAAKISRHIEKMKGKVDSIEINCTGGFKAEVAILHSVGSAMNVPVYYMHESFRCCVVLPQIEVPCR